ncbi:allantoinase PuuE [Acinetobacter qingfengensis]|uniref:Allantoinase n=1 Tax=Acinetobacter qingfengensis TaxID=1262585 RepID=A0A1E7R8W7_9GAMM|nr:allantoinase PuuE [Acinetobacter qingfengensis]KAA8735407.1 allantoinase PuuE [Acinetobacter qingfengensis]OEY95766.1 allantoinase [Acinetobacter qingfengensis]
MTSATSHLLHDSIYPRDLIGYANQPPHAQWPNHAKIALQFVLNYEEGGEKNVLHGDSGSEQFLSEIFGAESYPDRHLSMDSMYEYGSRVGFWRIQQEFAKRNLPMSIFGVAMALQRNPLVVETIKKYGYDVVSHGARWLHYQNTDIATEREHTLQAIQILKDLFGQAPSGWYTGRDSPNTRQILAEFPEIQYDSDYYGDDLPFWTTLTNQQGETRPHLIIPYTLDTNDMKFASPIGFSTSEQFFDYLKDSFDVLYAEGAERPKMMSIGMHCRLLGKPARFKALQRFLDYVQSHHDVWICTRQQIADHWYKTHPYQD